MVSKKTKKKYQPQYKICSTCTEVKKTNSQNIYSLNNENWKMFPENIPILGRTHGTQKELIDIGKQYSNCLLYYFASRQKDTDKIIEFPKAYQNSNNNGLVKLDANGKAYVHLDCPQPYKEDGVSYLSHFHFIVSNKTMTQWSHKLGTQAIICKVDKKEVKRHLKNCDRLIINALPESYFLQNHIKTSANLYYKEAEKMTIVEIKENIKQMIKQNKPFGDYLKKHKIPLEDTPILVYCYDAKCSAGVRLANELARAGFTNIIDYKNGMLGWLSRN